MIHSFDVDGKKHILSYEPTRFLIGYQTYGNCKKSNHIITTICKDIKTRVLKFTKIIEEYNKDSLIDHIGDELHFTNMGDMYKYTFYDETRTIVNLFSDYSRSLSPENFNVPGRDHPSQPTAFVKIIHTQPHLIMLDASKKIIEDLDYLLKFFS